MITIWLPNKHQEENMELKKRKSQQGEDLQWNDYMSLSFTQDVSKIYKQFSKTFYINLTAKLWKN